MRITDILIDRFGRFPPAAATTLTPAPLPQGEGIGVRGVTHPRPLVLSPHPRGVTVFYGPNEAGKTTLLRFLRGVLYGFDPDEIPLSEPGGATPRRIGADVSAGSLRVESDGKRFEIRRMAQPGSRGLLSVIDPDHRPKVEGSSDGAGPETEGTLIEDLLCHTNEAVFERIFAISLHELQQLATLDTEEVAQHIYDVTLGAEGRKLLDVSQDVASRRHRLCSPDRQTGELVEALQHDAELADQLASCEEANRHHLELCRRREQLETEIADLKSRQAGMESQLRGHEFLKRVWTPWNQVRELQRELAGLPIVAAFPEDGPQRLAELDAEIDSATRLKDTLTAEADDFRSRAEAQHLDPRVGENEPLICSVLRQRDWLCELEEKTNSLQTQTEGLQAELDETSTRLGPDWPTDRLDAVDVSPDAARRLLLMARRYLTARHRWARLRNRYRRSSNSCQKQLAELNERMKRLDGGPSPVDEALAAARRKLTALKDLDRLTRRRDALDQHRRTLDEQLKQLESRPQVPKWAAAMLGGFTVIGIGFVLLGTVDGVGLNVLAGATYALLGLTCGATAWAVNASIVASLSDRSERLRHELREIESRLDEIRNTIPRVDSMANAVLPLGEHRPGPGGAKVTDPILQTLHQTAELEQLAGMQRRLQSKRRRLSEFRSRLQAVQRDTAAVRKEWCELLVELGLPETVRIDEAFQTYNQISGAIQRRRQWQTASDELTHYRSLQETFLGPLLECGIGLGTPSPLMEEGGGDGSDAAQPSANSFSGADCVRHCLTHWEQSLHTFATNRAEQQHLYQEEQTRRHEADEYQKRIDELHLQRMTLFAMAGAATHQEFDERCRLVRQRRELEELLELAHAELTAAAQTEPELATVEEDLLDYDAEQNQECIDALNRELHELKVELEHAIEQLGGLKQEIGDLEADRRSAELRLDRNQSASRLKHMFEQWCTLQLAGHAVEQMRNRFERLHQPKTLKTTSEYLAQLTRGKHQRVWTPLDERQLVIEDAAGTGYRVEQLSGGTREQLFLAIRLALVRELARSGVELPIILDDVLVNFDQERTEAAVETLIRCAEDGQQILLFTCHLHLAHMFESRGIEPFRLPGPPPDRSDDDATENRRAG